MNRGYQQNYYTPGVPNYSPGMPGYTPGVPNYSPGMSNYRPGMPGYLPGVQNCPSNSSQYTPGVPNYSSAVPNYSPAVPNYSHAVHNQHEAFYPPTVEAGMISCPVGQPGIMCSENEPGIPYPSAPPIIMDYLSYPSSCYTPGTPNNYPY